MNQQSILYILGRCSSTHTERKKETKKESKHSYNFKTLYSPARTICTASLTFTNPTFSLHTVLMCFMWIWEQSAIISLYNINWLVFATETESVYCAVRTGTLASFQVPRSIQYTVCCIQYTVYCIHYTVHSILYAVYCIEYTVHGTQYTAYSILYTVYSTLYTVYNIQHTVYCILCTVCCTQYTVYCTQYAVCCTQYTVYCVQHTVCACRCKKTVTDFSTQNCLLFKINRNIWMFCKLSQVCG